MPFKSQAQRRFMYAKHPEMAAEWESHTPKGAKLPQHVKKRKKRIKKAAEACGVPAWLITLALGGSDHDQDDPGMAGSRGNGTGCCG